MRAAPDGYTLSFGHHGSHVVNGAAFPLPFDLRTDLEPVALLPSNPLLISARKDLPANTFQEFAALLKKDASKMKYGSAGAGTTTHLGCSLLNAKLGVNVTHVPYRGSAPASNDLMGGQIDYLCGNLGAAAPLIIGKQVKAIAVLSRERSPLMPELASAHEQGLTDFDVTTWTAFFLPKGTPRPVVDKLNDVTHATMETPAIKARMLEVGVTGVSPERRSPEYLVKFVADEVARWEGPIKSAGLQVD